MKKKLVVFLILTMMATMVMGMTSGVFASSEVCDAIGHAEYLASSNPATCTSDGSRSYNCSRCGGFVRSEPIPATGHTDGTSIVTQQPTCTGTGTKTTYCSTCSEITSTETLPALGHDWGEWQDFTDARHKHTCQRCSISDTAPHNNNVKVPRANDPLNHDTYCSVCGRARKGALYGLRTSSIMDKW